MQRDCGLPWRRLGIFWAGIGLGGLAVWIACVAAFALPLYFQDVRSGARMSNVRKPPPQIESATVATFLARAKQDHERSGRARSVLVAGDSQLYGYFLPPGKTVGARLAQLLPDTSVYNVSKVAGAAGWGQAVLQRSIRMGFKPDVLVVHMNPAVNAGVYIPVGNNDNLLLATILCPSCAAGVALHAREHWLAGKPSRDPFDEDAIPPGNGEYLLIKLEKSYYPPRPSPDALAALKQTLELTKQHGVRLVMIASPHQYDAYNKAPYLYGWDTSVHVAEYMRTCRLYPHASCLDRSKAYGTEKLFDVIHLKPEGHSQLAAEIAAALDGAVAAD